MLFPNLQFAFGKFPAVRTNQDDSPATFVVWRVSAVEGALLHEMAINDDDFVMRNCVFGINPFGYASVRDNRR